MLEAIAKGLTIVAGTDCPNGCAQVGEEVNFLHMFGMTKLQAESLTVYLKRFDLHNVFIGAIALFQLAIQHLFLFANASNSQLHN